MTKYEKFSGVICTKIKGIPSAWPCEGHFVAAVDQRESEFLEGVFVVPLEAAPIVEHPDLKLLVDHVSSEIKVEKIVAQGEEISVHFRSLMSIKNLPLPSVNACHVAGHVLTRLVLKCDPQTVLLEECWELLLTDGLLADVASKGRRHALGYAVEYLAGNAAVELIHGKLDPFAVENTGHTYNALRMADAGVHQQFEHYRPLGTLPLKDQKPILRFMKEAQALANEIVGESAKAARGIAFMLDNCEELEAEDIQRIVARNPPDKGWRPAKRTQAG